MQQAVSKHGQCCGRTDHGRPPPHTTSSARITHLLASAAKAKRGERGLPPHVQPMHTKTEGTKYVARLRWLPAGATKKRYDYIPGTFVSPAAAAAAQVLAQDWLTASGPEAVWADGLPGSKGPRVKRDADFWKAQLVAREEKAAEKAAAQAAREAAEAAVPKKPRQNKCPTSVPMPPPEARNTVTNECMRAFLADPPAAGAENAAPQPPPVPHTHMPMPVPPGLDVADRRAPRLVPPRPEPLPLPLPLDHILAQVRARHVMTDEDNAKIIPFVSPGTKITRR